ncbi:Glycerol-3-phosphate/dihydroxyacetone phosphate acyltransferase, partial [Basidiobolus ranarum]
MVLTIYTLALNLFWLIVKLFFRDISQRGAHKIPKTGPVFFVAAPHANQFLDPLLLLFHSPRPISFLMAASSMSRKYIGAFGRSINSIPVARAQDHARKGVGTIQLLDRYNDPTRITGIGTKFTSDLQPGCTIALPNGAGVSIVEEVISDTEVLVKKEFKELKALELLTANEGTDFKIIPHLDQSQVYTAVHERLNQGGCVGIFPEGGSHDRAEMLPLKVGIAIMALGAMAENPGLNVKIVPCGLNYFHPHRFRSRAVVEFGDPLTIPRHLVEQFKEGGAAKREAIGKLMDTISNALRSVTINAPDYETLMVIQAGRRLYKPAHRKLRTTQVVDLTRRFVAGYLHFKDEPAVIDFRNRVLAYNRLLKDHGLRDHQVKRMQMSFSRALLLFNWRLLTINFMALIALPGAILNAPIGIIAKIISKKKAKEALKNSTVKIAGRDVLATWKVLVGLFLIPTFYWIYTFIMLYIAIRLKWPLFWKVLAPVLTFTLLPFISYASVRFGETGLDVYRSMRPLFFALFPGAGKKAKTLPVIREELSNDITLLINELGPQLFPDFDPNRIANGSHPSTPGTPGTPKGRKTWIISPMEYLNYSLFNLESVGENEIDDELFFLRY